MTVDYPYRTSTDRDPEGTRRRVLTVLAEAKGPMRRREIQQVAFGTDLAGAGHTATALRWLEEHRLAERSRFDSRKWSCTEAGRLAVVLADEMDEAS